MTPPPPKKNPTGGGGASTSNGSSGGNGGGTVTNNGPGAVGDISAGDAKHANKGKAGTGTGDTVANNSGGTNLPTGYSCQAPGFKCASGYTAYTEGGHCGSGSPVATSCQKQTPDGSGGTTTEYEKGFQPKDPTGAQVASVVKAKDGTTTVNYAPNQDKDSQGRLAVSRTTSPDGSVTTTFDDKSTEKKTSDGSTITTSGDGNLVHTTSKDGLHTTDFDNTKQQVTVNDKAADGSSSSTTFQAGGDCKSSGAGCTDANMVARTTQAPDGSSTTITKQDGGGFQVTKTDSSGNPVLGPDGNPAVKTCATASDCGPSSMKSGTYTQQDDKGNTLSITNKDGTTLQKKDGSDGFSVKSNDKDLAGEVKAKGGKAMTFDKDGNILSAQGMEGRGKIITKDVDISEGQNSADKCATAGGLGMGCNGTHTLVEGAKVIDQVGQIAGAAAVQFAGQNAQMDAQTKGTQSAALRAAADTARMSGQKDMTLGGVNALMGAAQLLAGSNNSSDADKIKAELGKSRIELKNQAKEQADAASRRLRGNEKESIETSEDGRKAGQNGNFTIKNDLAKQIDQGWNIQSKVQVVSNVDAMTRDKAEVKKINDDREAAQAAYLKAQAAATNPAGAAAAAAAKAKFEKADLLAKQANNTYAVESRDRNLAIGERQDALNQKAEFMANGMDKVGRAAQNELRSTAQMAQMQGALSLVKAAQQLTSGAFALASANKLDDAADKLQNIEGQQQGPTFAPFTPGQVDHSDGMAPGPGQAISGNGTGQAQSAAGSDDSKDNTDGLGPPISEKNPNDGLKDPAPPPGKFAEKDSPNGGGGAGGGFGGGGSTAAAQGGGDDQPQAQMAKNDNGAVETSGGTFMGGGGGGRGAEGGPDLSGMLAAFLPKKDEDQAKNGILDYGNRGPAAEQPFTPLGANVNIFERIHATYQDKHSHGIVKAD